MHCPIMPPPATPTDLPADAPRTETRRKVTDIFTREEIRLLTARSDAQGFLAVGFTWSVIAATLAMLAWAAQQPGAIAVPLFVIGFAVLGGRHLALAILMHEASHGTLFRNKRLNDMVGDWLCAKPVWSDLRKYRVHHFIHHTRTGQADDTDISLIEGFPCSRASLARKLLRDISGLTGLKFLLGRLLMDAGVLKWTVASDVERLPQEGRSAFDYLRDFVRNSYGMWITNGVLLAICWLAGHPWLYAAWVLAYLTPFPFFLRIRSLAEHACTERSADMFCNTRSTRAGFLARMTVAPHRVNYHIEHHVMASVPFWRLPLMHRLLRERDAVLEPPGYVDVLNIVSSQRSTP